MEKRIRIGEEAVLPQRGGLNSSHEYHGHGDHKVSFDKCITYDVTERVEKVVFSCHHQDVPASLILQKELEKLDLVCKQGTFSLIQIPPGGDWRTWWGSKADKCAVMILLVSSLFWQSEGCQDELEFIESEDKQDQCIVVLIEEISKCHVCQDSFVWRREYIDFSHIDWSAEHLKLDTLTQAVQAICREQTGRMDWTTTGGSVFWFSCPGEGLELQDEYNSIFDEDNRDYTKGYNYQPHHHNELTAERFYQMCQCDAYYEKYGSNAVEGKGDVLHFTGHGTGKVGLFFKGSEEIQISDLATYICKLRRNTNANVHLVFINACHSIQTIYKLVQEERARATEYRSIRPLSCIFWSSDAEGVPFPLLTSKMTGIVYTCIHTCTHTPILHSSVSIAHIVAHT